MFKNYLTHQFVLNFDRMCVALQLPLEQKQQLVRASRNLLFHFTESLTRETRGEELQHLRIAASSLRECRRALDAASVTSHELRSCLEVLEGRLERLCSSLAEGAAITSVADGSKRARLA